MSCFEAPMVSGYSRVPDPPARMMPLRVKMETPGSAVPAAPIRRVQQVMRPRDDLAQVERLLEDGAGVVLQPGAHVLRLGVTAHDRDPADQRRLPRNESEVEREARHGGELDVEQHGIGGLGGEQLVRGLGRGGGEHAVAGAGQHALEHPPQGGLVLHNEDGGGWCRSWRWMWCAAHDAVACAWRGGTKPWAMSSTVKPGSCSRRWAYSTRAAARKWRGDGRPRRANQRSKVRRSTRARAATCCTVCSSAGARSTSSTTQRSSLGSGASTAVNWSSS